MIRLPYPPTVNTYWRSTCRGKYLTVYTTAKGKQYRKGTMGVILVASERVTTGHKDSLAVTIDVTFPDRRKRDLDNILKALLDALQHAGVYEDDSQIKDLRIRAVGVEKPGWVEVEWKPIEEG